MSSPIAVCEKANNNLRFLSARLCLEVWPSCFLLWGVLAFITVEVFALALGTMIWRFGVSGVTVKPDRSAFGNEGILPVRDARMVT